MADDRDMARLEATTSTLQTRLAMMEQAQARIEERNSTLKDRVDKLESGQRNVIFAILGIVITAVMRSVGFSK